LPEFDGLTFAEMRDTLRARDRPGISFDSPSLTPLLEMPPLSEDDVAKLQRGMPLESLLLPSQSIAAASVHTTDGLSTNSFLSPIASTEDLAKFRLMIDSAEVYFKAQQQLLLQQQTSNTPAACPNLESSSSAALPAALTPSVL
jgi:hypothetical protein